MVILSLICSSPPAEVQRTSSLYLLAAVAYRTSQEQGSHRSTQARDAAANEAFDGRPLDECELDECEASQSQRKVPDDVCAEVDAIVASADRFPVPWPVADLQAMAKQEDAMESALSQRTPAASEASSSSTSCGDLFREDKIAQHMHKAFCAAFPQLRGILQPLPGQNRHPQCNVCRVAFDGPHVSLTPLQRENRLPLAWVFVGRTIFKAPTRRFMCTVQSHIGGNRCFRPRGVEWTSATYLFNVQDLWFYAVSLLIEVTNMVVDTNVAPSTAIRYHLERSFQRMHLFAPEAKLPLLQSAVKHMYQAWYAYSWLEDDKPTKFAVCRLCGFFPKVGADACAKTLMSLSHAASRKQLAFPETPPVCCCVCRQLLGSKGGCALKFFCKQDIGQGSSSYDPSATARQPTHEVCFECLPKHSYESLLKWTSEDMNKSVEDHLSVLQNSSTTDDVVDASITVLQEVVNELCSREQGPCCPLCKVQAQANSPQVVAGPRLWTQKRLFDHCGTHLLRLCFHGSNPTLPAIPVEKLPPIFQAPEIYASNTLFNSSQLKSLNSGYASFGMDPPTADALEPLRQLVASGRLIPGQLRDNSIDDAEKVREFLQECHVPAGKAKYASAAKSREWLLQGLDLLTQGRDDCKHFVSAARGTGGTADVSCLHGVEICRKVLTEQESTRDYCDIFRSFRCFPLVVFIDASCGVVSTLKSNYPEEEEELFGDHRGTCKPFLEESEIIKTGRLPDLTQVSIPDFELCAAARYANDEEGLRSAAVEAARKVMKAGGKLRSARHPLQQGSHPYRAIVSDKWHQSPYVLKRSIRKRAKVHSHKKLSCTQHLAHVCSSLAQCRTSIMESLNSRRRLHLSTACTTDPVHHLVFLEKLRRRGNRRIIEKQDEALEKTLREGEVVIIDPDLGVARIVCSSCKQSGHTARYCRSREVGRSVEETVVKDEAAAVESGLDADTMSKSIVIEIHVQDVHNPRPRPNTLHPAPSMPFVERLVAGLPPGVNW